MTDDLERAIHITKEGWKVVDNPPKILDDTPIKCH